MTTSETSPCPGHADYTAQVKYGGFQDVAGAALSRRLTAPPVHRRGYLQADPGPEGDLCGGPHRRRGGIPDQGYDPVNLDREDPPGPGRQDFPVLDPAAGTRMQGAIAQAKEDLDSLGGLVECAVIRPARRPGDPMLDGMENRIARLAFAIPAVKGVAFGVSFAVADRRGSQNNDPFYFDEVGQVRTRTNHAGGFWGASPTACPWSSGGGEAHPLHRPAPGGVSLSRGRIPP